MVIIILQGDVLGLFQVKVLEPCLRGGGKTVVIAGDPLQTPTGYLLHKSLCQPVLSVLYRTYMVCPKSNENDCFAQRRRARKGK